MLRVLADRLRPGGRILVETAGTLGDEGATEGAIHVPRPGGINARDNYFFWQFSSGSLKRLAEFIDGSTFELHATPVPAGQSRIIGTISPTETPSTR
jgi:hypothetical protein